MTVTPNDPKSEFEKQAVAPASLARELFDFLRQNKKWWLIPILVVMLLVGSLAILAGTGAAPFVYTLF